MISYQLISRNGDRENNEDSVGMYQGQDGYYFALADGLGGHGKGELASRLAVEASVNTFATVNIRANLLEKSFDEAQKAVLKNQRLDYSAMDMKTTLVLLHVGAAQVQWGYIGDSRLYYFQDKKLVLRTLDHSVPQLLATSGKIPEKKIRNHPDRNKLLRVLGVESDVPRYQIEPPISRQGKQSFLLCSDGFWELIDERKMTHFLKRAKTPNEWLEKMEEQVKKAGKWRNMDNYSAIAVWIEDEG